MNKSIKFIVSITVCLLVGFVGSVFTTPAIANWYAFLNKPSFSPPNWLFAPVWTTLYILMGISLALVWNGIKEDKKDKKDKKDKTDKRVQTAIIFFAFQLVLNSVWSILFFGLKSPGLALVEIVFLWLAILLTIIKFYKISKIAACLLIPYLAWVSFASILNFAILKLN